MGYVPRGVLVPTVIVTAEVPAPGAGMVCGLKLTVVPVGTPEAERSMELLKVPMIVVVTMELPASPCCTVTELGESAIVKSDGAAVTVSVTVVFCWMPPPLPVTVMG